MEPEEIELKELNQPNPVQVQPAEPILPEPNTEPNQDGPHGAQAEPDPDHHPATTEDQAKHPQSDGSQVKPGLDQAEPTVFRANLPEPVKAHITFAPAQPDPSLVQTKQSQFQHEPSRSQLSLVQPHPDQPKPQSRWNFHWPFSSKSKPKPKQTVIELDEFPTAQDKPKPKLSNDEEGATGPAQEDLTHIPEDANANREADAPSPSDLSQYIDADSEFRDARSLAYDLEDTVSYYSAQDVTSPRPRRRVQFLLSDQDEPDGAQANPDQTETKPRWYRFWSFFSKPKPKPKQNAIEMGKLKQKKPKPNRDGPAPLADEEDTNLSQIGRGSDDDLDNTSRSSLFSLDKKRQIKAAKPKHKPKPAKEEPSTHSLVEDIYRRTMMKATLMETNNLYIPVFMILKANAEKECYEMGKVRSMNTNLSEKECREYDYNFHPLRIINTLLSSEGHNTYVGSTGSLLEFPNIHKSYIMLPGMNDENAEAFWQMIYDRRVPAVVMLSDFHEDSFRHCPVKRFDILTFGEYDVQCCIVKRTKDYVKRTMRLDKSTNEEHHAFVHYQFLGWAQTTPHHEMLARFHNLLFDESFMSQTPVFISSTGIARCGTVIIADVFLRMLYQGDESKYCIEEMVYQMCTMRNNGVQYTWELKVIYDHILQMMELREKRLRRIGIDLRDYAEEFTPLYSNPTTIQNFPSAREWPYDPNEIEAAEARLGIKRRVMLEKYRPLTENLVSWRVLWTPDDDEKKEKLQFDRMREIQRQRYPLPPIDFTPKQIGYWWMKIWRDPIGRDLFKDDDIAIKLHII